MSGRIVVRILCVFALVAICTAGFLPGAALAKDSPRPVPPPQPDKYSELSAQWWQWALAQRVSENPLLDSTGEFCGVGQSGQVWFLAGALSSDPIERTCTVPSGKRFFFPVINNVYVGFQSDPNDTVEVARAGAAQYIDDTLGKPGFKMAVQIDDFVLSDAELRAGYRVYGNDPTQAMYSPIFGVALPLDPADNIFGFDPTVFCSAEGVCSPSANDGVYVLTHPLAVGKHTIRFTATDAIDVTVHLIVVPGKVDKAGVAAGAMSASGQTMLYLPAVQQ